MAGLANTTAMATNVDKSPLTFDHESRKLAIIYGTLATVIALVGLVFAALTWYASRRSSLSAFLRASDEYELESNTPQRTSRQPSLSAHLRASREHDLESNMPLS